MICTLCAIFGFVTVKQTRNFYISVKNGMLRSLIQDIRGEILSETRTVVGILVDADDYPANHWRAVSDRLKRSRNNAAKRANIIRHNYRRQSPHRRLDDAG